MSFQGAIIKRDSGQRVVGRDYVLSTSHPDRVGDVVEASGWQLDNFQKNPVALFGHDHTMPVGRWKNVRVEGEALLGTLELAAAGTSAVVDTVRALVNQGVLKAVSVGFRSLRSSPIKGSNFARTFHAVELLEASLVSVPANAHAVEVAKSFGMSQHDCEVFFATKSDGERVRIGDSTEVLHNARLAVIAAKRVINFC